MSDDSVHMSYLFVFSFSSCMRLLNVFFFFFFFFLIFGVSVFFKYIFALSVMDIVKSQLEFQFQNPESDFVVAS